MYRDRTQAIRATTPIVDFIVIWPAFSLLSGQRKREFIEHAQLLKRGGFDAPNAIVDYFSVEDLLQDFPTIPREDAAMLYAEFQTCVLNDPAMARWHRRVRSEKLVRRFLGDGRRSYNSTV